MGFQIVENHSPVFRGINQETREIWLGNVHMLKCFRQFVIYAYLPENPVHLIDIIQTTVTIERVTRVISLFADTWKIVVKATRMDEKMKLRFRIIALFLVLSIGAYSQADEINYGDFEGTTVTYIDVTESSLEELPLYGMPNIVGNNLNMPGTGFTSQSQDGQVDFLDGRLTFMVEADPGTTFSQIVIEEFGAFFTFGESSISTVNAVAFVQTLEGDVVAGNYQMNFQGGDLPEGGDWLRTLTITFPETTKITVTLDNQLFTFADDLGVAFIDKKGVNIKIPEPSTAGVLALGLVGVMLRRRKR